MNVPGAPHTLGRLARPLALWIAAGATLAGCSVLDSGDDGDAASTADDDAGPAATVTVPPSRLTPFCQAMIDLAAELTGDDAPTGDDAEARIVEVYAGIADEVPDAIRDDFLTVLARLQSDTPPATDASTTAPPVTTAGSAPITTALVFDEGRGPDEDPALRLNAYIDATCRSTQNNPGPSATQPGVTLPDE